MAYRSRTYAVRTGVGLGCAGAGPGLRGVIHPHQTSRPAAPGSARPPPGGRFCDGV